MVVRLGARRRPAPVAPVSGGDVRLHPDDRLDVALLRLLLELPGGVQISVIGDRERRLLELGSALDELLDPVGAVEERVLGVAVQVYEGHRREDSDELRVTQKLSWSSNPVLTRYITTAYGTCTTSANTDATSAPCARVGDRRRGWSRRRVPRALADRAVHRTRGLGGREDPGAASLDSGSGPGRSDVPGGALQAPAGASGSRVRGGLRRAEGGGQLHDV